MTVMAAAATLVLAGCSSDSDGNPAADGANETPAASEPAAPEPENDGAGDEGAVRAAAREQADRHSSGDFGGAYDMWSADAKNTISREDYLAFADECLESGLPLEVEAVRLESDTEAVVRLGVAGFSRSYTMVYEDGEWAWVPTDEALQTYAADDPVRAAKNAGSC